MCLPSSLLGHLLFFAHKHVERSCHPSSARHKLDAHILTPTCISERQATSPLRINLCTKCAIDVSVPLRHLYQKNGTNCCQEKAKSSKTASSHAENPASVTLCNCPIPLCTFEPTSSTSRSQYHFIFLSIDTNIEKWIRDSGRMRHLSWTLPFALDASAMTTWPRKFADANRLRERYD